MPLPANDHPDPSSVPAPADSPGPAPVPGSRLGTVPVAMPGGLSASDESPSDARGMLGHWYGWPAEVGVLVLLASLFIWAMTLEPVQELDPSPKAQARLGAGPGMERLPLPLPAPAAPARTPRA